MLAGADIVCISSIDWDFIWQGHQEIMSAFAAGGNRVIFIENTGTRGPTARDLTRIAKRLLRWAASLGGFRRERENLYVYSPLALPFAFSGFARRLNRILLLAPLKRWISAKGFRDPIVWTYLPTQTAVDIIDCIPRRLLVYYTVADFAALSPNADALRGVEAELAKRCDLVFAQTRVLADKLGVGERAAVFPGGVNTDVFDAAARNPTSVPADLAGLQPPIIGYIGGLHRHVDFALLRGIALLRPDWSVVLVGPAQTAAPELDGVPNIIRPGRKEFWELPAYAQRFSVGIIPYVLSEYTRTVYPTKLNEYHALGKPVVSTALPEVLAFNDQNGGLVSIASTPEEFVAVIEKVLAEENGSAAGERVASARRNRWSERVAGMSRLIEDALSRGRTAPR